MTHYQYQMITKAEDLLRRCIVSHQKSQRKLLRPTPYSVSTKRLCEFVMAPTSYSDYTIIMNFITIDSGSSFDSAYIFVLMDEAPSELFGASKTPMPYYAKVFITVIWFAMSRCLKKPASLLYLNELSGSKTMRSSEFCNLFLICTWLRHVGHEHKRISEADG